MHVLCFFYRLFSAMVSPKLHKSGFQWQSYQVQDLRMVDIVCLMSLTVYGGFKAFVLIGNGNNSNTFMSTVMVVL